MSERNLLAIIANQYLHTIANNKVTKQMTHAFFRTLISALLTLSVFTNASYAEGPQQISSVRGSHSSLTLITSEGDYKAGEPFWLGLTFSLDEGWHNYWKNPGDAGFPPSLTWSHPQSTQIGPVHWPTPTRIEYDSLTDFGYHHDNTLLLPITLGEDATKGSLSLKAEWLVCNNICVPESAELHIDLTQLSAIANQSAIQRAKEALPSFSTADATLTYDKENPLFIHVTLPLEHINNPGTLAGDKFEIYPATANRVINRKGSITLDNSTSPATLQTDFELLKSTTLTDNFKLLLLQKGKKAKIYSFPQLQKSSDNVTKTLANQPSLSLALALFFAFLGGIILNIMPCVLPVLSLKILSAVKKSEKSPGEVIKHGVAYTLGIILSFVSLALIIVALQKTGQHIGWGFQMQSPSFVMFMALVFFLLGLNLAGKFELPHLMGNIGGSLANADSPSGSFFTGVLATLAATPCTVPFMAPAVGLALTLSPLENISIFIMLGLGMALPYLVITLIPAFSRFIPKPGAWMHRFKQWLAVPIYATVAYMLWVLYTQTSIVGAIIAAFSLILIHMAISWRDYIKGTFAIVLTIILLALALIANLPNATAGKLSGKAFVETLATAREGSQSVLVDVTASWCMTCQFNALTLHSNDVETYFAEQGITVITADWTHQDNEITKYLASFNRNGVPLYVYYPKDGSEPHILPQLLTEDVIREHTKD